MLDAVVVNYRTPDDLEGFLASWHAHAPDWCNLTIVNVDPTEQDVDIAKSYASFQVDVVGDALVGTSFDDPVFVAVPRRLVSQAAITYCRYHSYPVNVGYAYACNHAVVDSEADVFAFFNADTRILPGSIEPLYFNLMTHDDWGVIGPRQVDDDGKLTHAGILGTNQKPQLRGWMKRDNPAFCDVRDDAVSVMGSAYFVKRKCWEQLTLCTDFQEQHPGTPGAFLPTQHYYEETWVSYHARAHGWKVVYYGLSKMIHRWHKASPVGGQADAQFRPSQKVFRAMCDRHGIERD